MDLGGKVMLIAGVGPQIGAATALIAAREGASVAVAARTDATTSAVAEAIRSQGGRAVVLRCDLGVEGDIRQAVDATTAEFGRLDAVFYNAAFFDQQHIDLDVDEAVWDTTMAVNLRGPMTMAQHAIPRMLANGGGAFVFNSSAASLLAEEIRIGYGVSKAGLNAMIRFVAANYGRRGIRANGILPFVAGGEVGEAVAATTCLGRSGTAEEIGEVVVFLCSDRASIITGQLLHLDAGQFVPATWPSTTKPRVPPPPRT
jgi:NAD(P)-dependent dehydrogenase (short-subunit alcohol dehydrogenase family)